MYACVCTHTVSSSLPHSLSLSHTHTKSLMYKRAITSGIRARAHETFTVFNQLMHLRSSNKEFNVHLMCTSCTAIS